MNRLPRILKWIGIILGSIVVLVAIAFVVLMSIGNSQLSKKYEIAVTVPTIPNDAESIARGEHLATIVMCRDCHGDNLGGQAEFVIPGMLTIPTPNLTSGAGGVGRLYTDEDWVRAIQHGVGYDGRALFLMPSTSFSHLIPDDVGALIAYIKSMPPVDSELPQRSIAPVAQVMNALGMFPPFAVDKIDHKNPAPVAPEPGINVAQGEYLTRICTECHGEQLNGAPFGPPGEEVPSPNLTLGGPLASWTKESFFTTMRTGVTPGGKQLSEEMPWQSFGQMTDEELESVWLYLTSLPPLPQGG